MSENARGIFYMLLFVLVLPVLDVLMKELSLLYPPSQVLAARFGMLFLMLVPAAPLLPRRELAVPPGLPIYLIRGFLMAGASLFYVSALRTVPLANMAAIALLAPLIVTAVSPFLLGERVGWIRYSAVLFGFAGAMVVMRPSAEGLGEDELIALGAPVCFSAYVILTRKWGGRANQIGQLLWTCVGALLVLGAIAVWQWLPITREAFGLLLIAGVLSLFVYLLQIAAFSAGETSVIAPFSYLHIATAAGAGYFLYGNLPDTLAWIGMGMIVISGVVIALRS